MPTPLNNGDVAPPALGFCTKEDRGSTSRSTPEAEGRILQLDGVRGLAILAVFLHHAYRIKLLWMGVDLFFVLSGFLITGILLRAKQQSFASYLRHFYARRVRRIIPAYVMAMIVSSLVFGFAWIHYWYLFLGGMNFLYLMGLSGLTPIPLWSLAVEEQFYFLWPLAVFYLSPKAIKRCAVGIIFLAPVLRFLCTPLFKNHWAIYMLLPFRMDTLATGALIAVLRPKAKPITGFACIAGCLATLVVLSRLGFNTDSNTPIGNTFVYEATLLIVTSVFLMALGGVGKKFLELKALRFIGTISYSMYLIHLVFLRKWPSVAVAAAGTFAYAVLMWFLVEKPILEM